MVASADDYYLITIQHSHNRNAVKKLETEKDFLKPDKKYLLEIGRWRQHRWEQSPLPLNAREIPS